MMGGGEVGENRGVIVSFRLKFCQIFSCQLNFRPFVRCPELSGC